MVTKLEKLLIGEVSGVDDPANELPGWMVAKSTAGASWDVAAAESRIREATGAQERPTEKYASCFLWHDGEDAVPESYGDYKFLVCDVDTDGVVKVAPAAIDAAAERVPGSTLPDADKDAVLSAITKLREKIEKDSAEANEAQSIVGKIKGLIFPAGKEEVEMTKEELNSELDERFTAFGDSLVERLSKAAAEPVVKDDGGAPAVEPATTTAPDPDPAPAPEPQASISVEDVTKAVTETLQPVLEILDKALDRIERCETALGVASRKSLEGQEGQGTGDEKDEPSGLTTAIKSALAGNRVDLT